MGRRDTDLTIGGLVALAVSVGIALATVAAPAVAAPADDPASDWLRWARGEGAESCIGASELAARVGAQLGESPAAAARRSRRRIAVRIERRTSSPAQWSADLTLLADDDSVAGTRRIDRGDDSCGPLGEALVLVTVLILSEGPETGAAALAPPRRPVQAPASPPTKPAPPATPTSPAPPAPPPAAPATPAAPSTPPPPGPSPAGPPAPGPPPSPAAASPAPVVRSPSPARRSSSSGWRGSLATGPATGVGLLPNLALAGEVRLAVVPPSWPAVMVSAMVWGSERVSAPGGGASGATLSLRTAGMALCPAARVGKTRALSACLGVDVGRLRAAGFGFDTAFDRQSWAVDLSAGGRLRQQIGGGFFVGLDLRAVVPLLRDRITFVGADGASGEVFRMWPVGAVGGLEVGYNFR